jgi:hypothetical protein
LVHRQQGNFGYSKLPYGILNTPSELCSSGLDQ